MDTAGYPEGIDASSWNGLPERVAMAKKALKPGELVPASGQYEVIGPRGGERGREITGVRGKRLPPTQQPGEKYRLVDKTKHKEQR